MVGRAGNGALLIPSHGVTRVVPGRHVKIVLVKAGTEVGTIIASDVSIGNGGKGSYTWPIGADRNNRQRFQGQRAEHKPAHD